MQLDQPLATNIAVDANTQRHINLTANRLNSLQSEQIMANPNRNVLPSVNRTVTKGNNGSNVNKTATAAPNRTQMIKNPVISSGNSNDSQNTIESEKLVAKVE